MAKKVLFEVRERSADPAFQVVEDENGEIQTHYGATYLSETPTSVGARIKNNTITGLPEIMGQDGPYAALPLDANGNAIANINHRRLPFESLATLDGGVGEISVATEGYAMFLHNGVADQAIPFFKSTEIARVVADATGTSLTTSTSVTTYTPYPLDSTLMSNFDPRSLISVGTDGGVTIPAGATAVSVRLAVKFAASTSATSRRVRLEYFNGTNWFALTANYNMGDAVSGVVFTVKNELFATFAAATTPTHVRVAFADSSTTGLVVSAIDVTAVEPGIVFSFIA